MIVQIAHLKLFEDYIVTDPRDLYDRKCQRLFRIPTEDFLPILIAEEDNEVLDGYHRVAVAQARNDTELECLYVTKENYYRYMQQNF